MGMTLTSPHVEGDGRDGRYPEDREGHTASVIDKCIYIFGGTWSPEVDDNTIYMNDLHVLDVPTLSWRCPQTTGVPPIEREGHTAATLGACIYIFGGTWVDEDEEAHYLNDLYVLD